MCEWDWKTISISALASRRTSNAEQVRKIRRILEELSFEIATPSEVREILHLKGAENVHFA